MPCWHSESQASMQSLPSVRPQELTSLRCHMQSAQIRELAANSSCRVWVSTIIIINNRDAKARLLLVSLVFYDSKGVLVLCGFITEVLFI